jgi:hypothetical protein
VPSSFAGLGGDWVRVDVHRLAAVLGVPLVEQDVDDTGFYNLSE